MKQHVINEHGVILNRYKEQKKTKTEKVGVAKKGKKGKQCLPNPLLIFMFGQIFYKLNDLGQKRFIEDLVLLITKGYMHLSFVQNLLLCHFVMRQCDKVKFLHVNILFNNIFQIC
jgi:hypothetical protein